MLEACLALLKEKKIALTRDNSRWARQEIERQEEEERQKAFDKATEDKAAAKEEEKQAKAKLREAEDAKAREKAQRELEEAEARKRKAEEEERKNKAPPKKGSKRKKKKDPVPMGILEHDISANACQAAGLAEKTLKLLKGREKELKQLSPVALASLMEDMLSAVNLWRELVDKISAATPNKRGHLAAVPNAAE
jgi:flagellar biosynthesis GTPase FlhF